MENFGRYNLLELVGSGGMAEIYRAQTQVGQGLAKELVIKKILPKYARDTDFATMFVDEARVALGLNHPNIVQTFDFGTASGSLFLAMELVDGLDLHELMRVARVSKSPVPLGVAAYIAKEVARGLDYAHRKVTAGKQLHIIHRDISPHNVLLSWEGGVKITDFGIASAATSTKEEPGTIKGKLGYMSPEQARGKQVTAASDIYSLGLVLLEMVSGKPVFEKTSSGVLERVKAGAIPSPRGINPRIPVSLESVILKALAYEPAERYRSASEFQRALNDFLVTLAAEEGLADADTLAAYLKSMRPPDLLRKRTETMPLFETEVPTFDPNVSEVRERKDAYFVHCIVDGLAARSELTSAFLQALEDIAYRHNLHIQRRSEREFTLLAGVPTMTLLANREALQASVDLIERLEALGNAYHQLVSLRVGVHWGKVTMMWKSGGAFECHMLESDEEVVRRIASFGRPSDILVSANAFQLCKDAWEFSELKFATDSEQGVMDNAYLLLQQRDNFASRVDSVGTVPRPLYQRTLASLYQEVVSQRKKAQLIVVGEIGVGKKTLVEEFLQSLPKDDVLIIRGRSRVATSHTPFAVFADFARIVLGIDQTTSAGVIDAKLNMILHFLYPGEETSPKAVALKHIVADLLGMPNDEADRFDILQKRRLLVDAVLEVERKLEPQKVLILIAEDLHYSDAETRELFKEMLDRKSNRAVLGLGTSCDIEQLRQEMTPHDVRLLVLPELSHQEMVRMLKGMLIVTGDDNTFLNRIAEVVGGNPLFAKELLEELAEQGVVTKEGARYRLVAEEMPLAVPPTIQALLGNRLDRLPSSSKQLVAAAAVLGRRFSRQALLEIAQCDPDTIDHCIRHGVLRNEGPRIAFANEMVMRVAYGTLPPEEKRRLHLAAVDAVRVGKDFRPGHDEAIVARHYELAEDSMRAADAYLVATHHALRLGGYIDAKALVSKARKLMPAGDDARRFEATRLHEQIVSRLGTPEEQLQVIHELVKDAQFLGQPEAEAEACLRLADFYLSSGKPELASDAINDAEVLLEQVANANLSVRVGVTLAKGQWMLRTGDSRSAIELLEACLSILSTKDNETLIERARCLFDLGRVKYANGDASEAIAALAEGLVIRRTLGHQVEEAESLHQLGIVMGSLGEAEEALSHLKSAIVIDQQTGNHVGLAERLADCGQVYVDIGDLAQAESFLRKALALAKEAVNRRLEAQIIVNIGQMHFQKGNVEKAHAVFKKGESVAAACGDRHQLVRARTYWAWALLERGGHDERVLELCESAIGLAESLDYPVGLAYGLAVASVALARSGKKKEALEFSDRALDVRKRQPRPEGEEQILFLRSRVLLRTHPEEYESAIISAKREVERKANLIKDPQLKTLYLTARVPARILREYSRYRSA